jgi:hypothetical protein
MYGLMGYNMYAVLWRRPYLWNVASRQSKFGVATRISVNYFVLDSEQT